MYPAHSVCGRKKRHTECAGYIGRNYARHPHPPRRPSLSEQGNARSRRLRHGQADCPVESCQSGVDLARFPAGRLDPAARLADRRHPGHAPQGGRTFHDRQTAGRRLLAIARRIRRRTMRDDRPAAIALPPEHGENPIRHAQHGGHPRRPNGRARPRRSRYGLRPPRRPYGELCSQGPPLRRGAAGQFAGRSCLVAAGDRLENAAGVEARPARALDAAQDHGIAPRGRFSRWGLRLLPFRARRRRRDLAEMRSGDDVRLGRFGEGMDWRPASRNSRPRLQQSTPRAGQGRRMARIS